MNTTIINSEELSQNLTSKKSLMTTQELADALNVSRQVISRHANELGLTKNGVQTLFTEEQATQIKLMIQKSGRVDLPNVWKLENVNSDYEMELMTQKVIAYHIAKSNEYKLRAEQAEALNLLNAPKVDVFNKICDSTNLKTVKEVGSLNGYGEKNFFALLRGLGIFYKENGTNLPYREYINAGYFVTKEKTYERNGKPAIYTQIFFTGKGEAWITKKINHATDHAAEKYLEEKRLQEGR